MAVSTLARMLKPNVTSLGYALFLAINAAGVWGGVFPFLPLEFQTQEIVFWFFLAQALVFSASYFASALGVYFLPGPTRSFLVRLATIPYLSGWGCLIAAIYLEEYALALVIAGGAQRDSTCYGSVCSQARIPMPAIATSSWERRMRPCCISRCTLFPWL